MRKIAVVLIIILFALVAYRLIDSKPIETVGRDIKTSIKTDDVVINSFQAFFLDDNPLTLRAYGPSSAVVVESLGSRPVEVVIRLKNTGLGESQKMAGKGLISAAYRDNGSTLVLTLRAEPGEKAWVAPPRSGGSDVFKFAVMGDNRGGLATFRSVLDKAAGYGPDWMINLGDLVDEGEEAEYRDYQKVLDKAGLKVPYLSTPGNHDVRNDGADIFKRRYGPGSYSFDYGLFHFVVLETSGGRVNQEDMVWLKEDLRQALPPQAVILTHVPLHDFREGKDHAMQDKEQAQELKDLFESNRVVAVVSSHIHGYGSYEERGIRYVTTGGAGAPLDGADSGNHFVLATVKGEEIKFEKIDVKGIVRPGSSARYRFLNWLEDVAKSNGTLLFLAAAILILFSLDFYRRF